MKLKDVLDFFKKFNIDRSEILKVLSKLSNKDIVYFITNSDFVISKDIYEKLKTVLVEKKPIEYVLNEVEFMGLKIFVNENVLIPRIETEDLVFKVVEIIKRYSYKSIFEIGVGSGIIPISVFSLLKYDLEYHANDISQDAIKVCLHNLKRYNLDDKVKVYKGMFFQPFEYDIVNFDLIVSNPPYVESEYIDKSVSLKYEPRIALDGGKEGIDFFKKIIERYVSILPNLHMIFEINEFKAEILKKLFEPFGEVIIYKDSFGKPRILEKRRRKNL